MKKFLRYSTFFLPLLLTACESGGIQETLGLNREAPDEFTVVSRPPLTVPPEFTLRPPSPGEAPLGTAADAQARSLITGQSKEPAAQSETLSAGANSLLKRAGADAADTSIRDKLTNDAATPVDTSHAKTLMEQLTGADKNEPTVDAKKEAERLRANKDSGKPVTEGDVPEETPKEKSLIDRIF